MSPVWAKEGMVDLNPTSSNQILDILADWNRVLESRAADDPALFL